MRKAVDNFLEAFTQKTVMIFVAHEDDEIGAFGNLIVQLVKAEVNTYVVFMTNGDYEGLGKIRIREAVSALTFLGIKASNIIFLGYGDCLNGSDHHIIYNLSDTPTESHIRRAKTYGTRKYPEWCYSREGVHHAYTRKNLTNDMRSVILAFRPEYIFAGDFDWHADHRALSILIEEVIGRILQVEENYRPKVFKGFVYSTAYYAAPDYSGINLHSTLKPTSPTQFHMDNPFYDWEQRLRIPVDQRARTKLIHRNIIYQWMKRYQSQYIMRFFKSIANSDQVFWPRRTDSITYTSRVQASSGNGELLRDFKYLDCGNILADRDEMIDCSPGLWIPEEDDRKKSVTFYFKDRKDIDQVVLYENPEEGDNIEQGQLIFSNGYRHLVDSLRHDGTASKIYLPCQKSVEWMEFSILASTGRAGLAEIELYSPKKVKIWFIKIGCGKDYIYDYYSASEEIDFTVTAFDQEGNVLDLPKSHYRIQLIYKYRSEDLKEFRFKLKGKRARLRVKVRNLEHIQDEVTIHRLNPRMTFVMAAAERLDAVILRLDDLAIRLNKKWKSFISKLVKE